MEKRDKDRDKEVMTETRDLERKRVKICNRQIKRKEVGRYAFNYPVIAFSSGRQITKDGKNYATR